MRHNDVDTRVLTGQGGGAVAKRVRRRNTRALSALTAVMVSLTTYFGLASMAFNPGWGAVALALIAGALTLAATEVGVLAAVLALSIPITAAQPVVGIAFLVLGVAGVHYLGADGGRLFATIAASLGGGLLGPAWAASAAAGYALGVGEGALLAGLAAVSIQVLGVALGRERFLVTLTGGSPETRLVDFSADKVPASLFSLDWLTTSVSSLGSGTLDTLIRALSNISDVIALVAQPLLWASAAILAGLFAQAARKRRLPFLGLGGVAIASMVPAIGAAVLLPMSEVLVPASEIATAAIGSAAAATGFAFLWNRYFPLEVMDDGQSERQGSIASEDADVDELLRLIATAEERLATDHTTNRVIMITDMKSFSTMTEEDGSVLTAKAIQKHRDLLIPLIERHGGHGKSTGGDGLVAAFQSPGGALRAAAQMQAALAAHNVAHPHSREMTVRIGIAGGEVVLDRHGRPFIGTALNLAARVMNLADGGQAFAAADVVAQDVEAVPTVSHGEFVLKNIAEPVEVFEILWAPDIIPMSPKDHKA